MDDTPVVVVYVSGGVASTTVLGKVRAYTIDIDYLRDDTTPIEEVQRALDDLKKSHKFADKELQQLLQELTEIRDDKQQALDQAAAQAAAQPVPPGVYPLGHSLNKSECAQFGVSDLRSHSIQAVAIGEKRRPRKDEWYLSPVTNEAYRTSCDLTIAFQIARLVRVKLVPMILPD